MYWLLKIVKVGFSLLLGAVILAGTGIASDTIDQPHRDTTKSRWAVAFDNDVLVPGSRDQDYTYGINLTFAGRQVESHWASLHRPLAWIDERVGINGLIAEGTESSKIEYGLFGFTPEDISQSQAQQNDRPYASLIYVSSTRENYDPMCEVSWQSTLTLGVIGLNVVGEVQKAVHSSLDGETPRGWNNQISDGGELTARYGVSRQKLLLKSDSGLEVKSTVQGSVGYITEASWSLSSRAGNIITPWVSFNPELTSYGEKSIPNASTKVSEHYAWAGMALKLRAYNAFLQGQFKDSAVTYRSNEINHAIVEAWVGYTIGLDNGYSISYSIRGHTSELKQGNADRSVVWGGILLSKSLG